MTSMVGKTVLVTGGTGGIGRATAHGLAKLGADVAITGRDRCRADEAASQIRTATAARVEVFIADLASQLQIRRMAEEVLERLPRIDVLVNNVGGYWNSRQLTPDGIERTFAVNHLAPFLLTNLLLARLAENGQARVVTVSSHAHVRGRIDFEDLQGSISYSGAHAYSQSKLANVLFSYELARRMNPDAVASNAVHPGIVSTSFGADDPGRTQRLLVPLLRPFMKNADQGAATSIHVASARSLSGVTGSYFAKSQVKSSATHSHDVAVAGQLWRVSSEVVGLPASDPL